MKKTIIILSFFGFLSAQTDLFEPGYAGIEPAFSQTFNDTYVNNLLFSRVTASDYKVEADLNYATGRKYNSNISSVRLDFSRLLFKNRDQLLFPVSDILALRLSVQGQ